MICHYGREVVLFKMKLSNPFNVLQQNLLQQNGFIYIHHKLYFNFRQKNRFSNLINIHFSLRSVTCFSFLYSSFTLCRSKYLLNVLCNFEQILPVALLLIPLLLQSQLSQLHQLEGQLTKRVLTKQFRFKIWCFWIYTITCQKDSCAKSFKKHSCCHCI